MLHAGIRSIPSWRRLWVSRLSERLPQELVPGYGRSVRTVISPRRECLRVPETSEQRVKGAAFTRRGTQIHVMGAGQDGESAVRGRGTRMDLLWRPLRGASSSDASTYPTRIARPVPHARAPGDGRAAARIRSGRPNRVQRTAAGRDRAALRERLRLAHENYGRQGWTVGALTPGQWAFMAEKADRRLLIAIRAMPSDDLAADASFGPNTAQGVGT
jgi:hypothetical protein